MNKMHKKIMVALCLIVFISSGFLYDRSAKGIDMIRTVMTACGGGFTMFLKSDGTVWVSGDNDYEVLGKDGANIEKCHDAIKIKELSDIIQISAGYESCLALKSDGTVYSWGGNEYGQLGNGYSGSSSNEIQQVKGLTDVIKISTRNSHCLALKKDGTVWGWGENDSYELGLGYNSPEAITQPLCIKSLSKIKDISAGYSHSLAVRDDGAVFGWGNNRYGALGDGTYISRKEPYYLSAFTDVKKVVAGGSFSVVLKNDGTIWTTGYNEHGQLGDGTTNSRSKLVKVTDVSNFKDIFAGTGQVYAVTDDNNVWSWGDNEYASVGHDYEKSSYLIAKPAIIDNLKNVNWISAGSITCTAITDEGTVYAWGCNESGQLSLGYDRSAEKPLEIGAGKNAVGFSVSGCSLILNSKGEVWQLGFDSRNSNNINKTVYQGVGVDETKDIYKVNPQMKIGELSDITQVKAGATFYIALDKNGEVWSWGVNDVGQLGDGTYNKKGIPGKVSNLNNVVAIAAGNKHAIALKSDGTVWMWGDDYYTVKQQNTPVQVKGLSEITAIDCNASNHNLALKKDGTVWAWGKNEYGDLGSDTSNIYAPIQVDGISNVKQICTGDSTSFALKEDGTLWAWGFNYYGELGIGSNNRTYTPTKVVILNKVKCVGAGRGTTAAIREDGSLWVWGDNSFGQLSEDRNSIHSSNIPVKIENFNSAKYLVGGYWNIMIQKDDGSLWGLGANSGSFGVDPSTIATPRTVDMFAPQAIYSKCDINRDGSINAIDLGIIASNYEMKKDDNDYNQNYDINNDGIIDIYDISMVAKQMQ